MEYGKIENGYKRYGLRDKTMALIYCIILLIMISPPLYNNIMFRYVMLFFMLLWMILDSLRNNGVINRVGILAFIFLFLSMLKTGIDVDSFLNPRITKIYFYCYFVLVYSRIENKLEYYKKCLWLLLLIMPIWLVISISNGLAIPDLFRGLSGSGLYDNSFYASKGVVGYDYIYSIVICIPVLFGLLIKKNMLSPIQRILVLINIVLSVLLIVIANYALAFFTLFLCTFLFIIFKKKKITIGKILITFAVIVLLVILTDKMLQFFIKVLSGTYYQVKIIDLYSSIYGGEAFGRIDIWMGAIKEFLNNPLWGNGFKHGVNTHSELLYSLVYYGVIVGGIEIYLLFYPLKRKEESSELEERVRRSVLAGFFVVTMFNPSATTLGAVLITLYGISQYYFV